MSITLFKHNQDAYESALELLSETGKAAVIHPTGKGKSFIGFKLCEDFSNTTVCWLSPSEYIFKIQLENIKKAADGYVPQNVKFFTYARLMNMTEAEMEEIAPEYIILDEFYRCVAEMWGEGVKNLLNTFPNARILGLSATAIRFLDNRRDMAAELFGGIDENPHVYSAYSENPETSVAFEGFKNDKSEHLKLLFCIDMLNEGIHVDNVSGVILLWPTISPIIYKQQIGRALSASQKNNAVIFDIVMNIESLYSIGAIEEEMEIATTYYRDLGMEGEIVNEHFKVIDEVRDCVELFDKLNEVLTSTWESMYKAAKEYHRENGDLEVPRRYITAEGYALGSWLNTQRLVRAGKTRGILTDKQLEKLDALGMRWESARDVSWEASFTAAKKYFDEHGDLLAGA